MRYLSKKRALIVGLSVLVGGLAFAPSPVEAAKMTKEERIAWKRANVSCKAESKGARPNGKKLGWWARRTFVRNCLVESLKGYPQINVDELMKIQNVRDLRPTVVQKPSEFY